MISIQQMNYIVVLSEEQQFQRAAERCFVTQPTLSMQLKKAEDSLGYAVFNRDKTPLCLTEAGKQLLPILRELLAEHDKIKRLSDQLKGTLKEEIRIGIIPTIAAYLLPDLFYEWRRTFSDLTFRIRELKTTEVLDAFERKEIDLAFIAGPHQDPRLRSIPIYLEEIFIYCPAHPQQEISLEELQQLHPWFLTKGNCLRTQMLHFCQLHEQHATDWDYEGGNLPLLLDMVDKNGGYTLVPAHFKLNHAQKKGIKKLNGTQAAPAREIMGLIPQRSMKTAHSEALIKSVKNAYARSKPEHPLSVLDWNRT